METFLRKYFWTVNLAAIFAAAVLVGRATNRVIEPSLFGAPSKAADTGKGSRLPSTLAGSGALSSLAGLRKNGRESLKRNMFCSECAPYDSEAVKDTSVKQTDDPNADIPRSTLKLALISTVTSQSATVDPDDDWSFATIKDTTTQAVALYRVKSTLPTDGASVERIETARVVIRNSGKLEYIDLKESKDVPAVSVGGAAVRPGGAGTGIAGVSPDDLTKGVRKLGDNKYEIDRALINKLLGNTGALASTARIVPSQKDGKPDGFRVYGIRPGGLWAVIGVQNGDTIHAINGLDMTTPDKALEVYTKVKNANHLTIGLSRRNQPVTMDYAIR